MAEQNYLFPVFSIEDTPDETEESEKYHPSVYFDYALGDFQRDGAYRMVESNGRDAYIQWCMKVISTERDAFEAYSSEIGTEFEMLSGIPDRETRETKIESTITDALMVHPATEYVRDFEFEHSTDSCIVTFIVKGYPWSEEQMTKVITER